MTCTHIKRVSASIVSCLNFNQSKTHAHAFDKIKCNGGFEMQKWNLKRHGEITRNCARSVTLSTSCNVLITKFFCSDFSSSLFNFDRAKISSRFVVVGFFTLFTAFNSILLHIHQVHTQYNHTLSCTFT